MGGIYSSNILPTWRGSHSRMRGWGSFSDLSTTLPGILWTSLGPSRDQALMRHVAKAVVVGKVARIAKTTARKRTLANVSSDVRSEAADIIEAMGLGDE